MVRMTCKFCKTFTNEDKINKSTIEVSKHYGIIDLESLNICSDISIANKTFNLFQMCSNTKLYDEVLRIYNKQDLIRRTHFYGITLLYAINTLKFRFFCNIFVVQKY